MPADAFPLGRTEMGSESPCQGEDEGGSSVGQLEIARCAHMAGYVAPDADPPGSATPSYTDRQPVDEQARLAERRSEILVPPPPGDDVRSALIVAQDVEAVGHRAGGRVGNRAQQLHDQDVLIPDDVVGDEGGAGPIVRRDTRTIENCWVGTRRRRTPGRFEK